MFQISRARLILVPLLTCACHTSSIIPIAPNMSGALPRHSTVVLLGGERVSVEDGRTTRDSLIGARASGTRFAVPRDSVFYVEARKVDTARSIKAIGAGVGGVAAALALA